MEGQRRHGERIDVRYRPRRKPDVAQAPEESERCPRGFRLGREAVATLLAATTHKPQWQASERRLACLQCRPIAVAVSARRSKEPLDDSCCSSAEEGARVLADVDAIRITDVRDGPGDRRSRRTSRTRTSCSRESWPSPPRERELRAPAGSWVQVPAGVAHRLDVDEPVSFLAGPPRLRRGRRQRVGQRLAVGAGPQRVGGAIGC